MVERICPSCGTGNEIETRICLACGAALGGELAQRPREALSLPFGTLPVRWQQAGKAAALGVAALAVEAGAAWLQHRAARRPMPLARTMPSRAPRERFVARQRVWETYEAGKLTRRVVEQTLWHLGDE